MRFLNFALALTGTLMATVGAAPTEPGNNPSTAGPTFARGNYGTLDANGTPDLNTVYANGHYENVPEGKMMEWIMNWGCGFCIVFKGRDAQGDITWSGGSGPWTKSVTESQSYFCYNDGNAAEKSHPQARDDKVTAAAPIEVSKPVNAAAKQQPRCGDYYLIEEEAVVPLYASGHYENVEEAVHMSGVVNLNCGFCIVFAGRDAQGDVLWSSGPGSNQQVRGGQSYYCS